MLLLVVLVLVSICVNGGYFCGGRLGGLGVGCGDAICGGGVGGCCDTGGGCGGGGSGGGDGCGGGGGGGFGQLLAWASAFGRGFFCPFGKKSKLSNFP